MADIEIEHVRDVDPKEGSYGAMDDVGVFRVSTDDATFMVVCGRAFEYDGPFPADGRQRGIERRWEAGELMRLLDEQGEPVTFGVTNRDLA